MLSAGLAWSSYIGGRLDGAGDIFFTGETGSSNFAGANNSYRGGSRDAFAAKLTAAGTSVAGRAGLVPDPVMPQALRSGRNVSHWTGLGDGVDWHDPLNWSGQVVPGLAHDVVIQRDPPGETGAIVILGPANARSIQSNAPLDVIGSLTLEDSSRFEARVAVFGAVVVRPGADAVLKMNELTLNSASAPGEAARFDLGDGTLLVDYTDTSPMGTLLGYLEGGYNGGGWDGPGLMSSLVADKACGALGYAEAGELFTTFPHVFAGQPIDDTTLIVRHTLPGDADLDRTVNLSDFNRLAASFGQPPDVVTGWSQGNFNFDGVTNLADFNILAGNFGQSAGVSDDDHDDGPAQIQEGDQ